MLATNSDYPLEHKHEFNRLEEQAKAKGYECEPEIQHLLLRRDDTLLDAGCGSGVTARYLARQNPHAKIIGCDSSPDRVLQAADAARDIHNLMFIPSDLCSLKFESNSFDVTVCRYVFHHLSAEKRAKAIAELFRCLKPGGRIISADPDGMFHMLQPMPEVVSQVLAILKTKEHIDLFAGGATPQLYLRAGFEAPKYRVEIISENSEALFQEKKLMSRRFEQFTPFLGHVLNDMALATKFRDAFLKALEAEGSVYYCPKVIVTAVKPARY